MPRIVEAPLQFAPHNCLITGREDGEIIDFELDANLNEPCPHAYIQRGVIEEAARVCCGMVSASEVDALRLQLESFKEKVAELQADLDVAKGFEERFGRVVIEPAVPAGIGEEGS